MIHVLWMETISCSADKLQDSDNRPCFIRNSALVCNMLQRDNDLRGGFIPMKNRVRAYKLKFDEWKCKNTKCAKYKLKFVCNFVNKVAWIQPCNFTFTIRRFIVKHDTEMLRFANKKGRKFAALSNLRKENVNSESSARDALFLLHRHALLRSITPRAHEPN